MDRDGPGARLLLTDLSVLFLMLNEGRHRTLRRLLGVSRDQSNLVTMIVLGILLVNIHEKSEALKQGPSDDAIADMWLGTAALSQLLGQLAGPVTRNTPFAGELLLLAALGSAARPAVRALRDWHPGHRMMVHVHHRYGHLLPWRRSRISPSHRAASASYLRP